MVFDIQNILILIAIIANTIIGIFVLFRNQKNKVNVTFFLIPLSMVLWSISMIVYRSVTTVESSILWAKILYFFPSAIPLVYVLFCIFFVRIKIHRVFYFLLPVPYILLAVSCLMPDLVIKDVILQRGAEKIIIFGDLYYYSYIAYFVLYSVVGYILLVWNYLKSSGVRRSQIKFVFYGTFLSGTLGLITNLFLPTFGYFKLNWLAQVFFLIYVFSIAYAIMRYRLMDVRLVIVRSIVFGFFILLLTAIYAILSTIIAAFFENLVGVTSDIIVGIVVAIFVVVGYRPLRRFIERATNRFLYKKTYDPDQLLAQVSEVTASILDLKHLLASISGTLDEAFYTQKIGVALLNKKKKLAVAYKKDFEPGVAEGLVGFPGAVQALYKELKQVGGTLVIDEMKTRFENGEFQPVNPGLLLKIHENDIALILPLYVKEQLIGIIALGSKKSGDPFNHQDLKTLKIIGGQAAIAIENARLYEELKGFSARLEDQVKKKTAELRRANAELRQLDRAKSEFISIASHQLRTPLTVIKGYISMMREGSFGEIRPEIMRNLEKVYISNERLIGLVENLLDISRIESGRQDFNWQKVQLEDVAQTVVDNLKKTAKDKNLKLFIHKPKKLTPKVTADPNKIHEVMMNFIDNAIKYTNEGEINVFVRSEPKEDSVTFCVKDTGRGIAPEIKAHLFRKFSRGKGSFRVHTEGVGLGLYVAKMIIDAHQGKIWAESKGRDKGASFCFALSTEFSVKDLKAVEPVKKFGQKYPSKKAS